MPAAVTVQYLGTVRLMLGKKEEVYEFSSPPNLSELIKSIGFRYGNEILKECERQAFFLKSPGEEYPKQVKLQEGPDLKIEHNSTIRIVSMITGG